jgi:ABC-type uncharacterized transport system ATPase subunit
MLITATKLEVTIGHYLDEITHDDVYIARNGKIVAKLSSPAQDKQAILDSLAGIAVDNPVTLEEARAERLVRQ